MSKGSVADMGTHIARCKYCESRIVYGTRFSPRKWVRGGMVNDRYFDKCPLSPGKTIGEHVPDRNTVTVL